LVSSRFFQVPRREGLKGCSNTLSETSTLFDETTASSTVSALSEGGHWEEDLTADADEALEMAPRGWSMRRGHMRKARRPKRGKAAVWAEIQGQGQAVSKGRAAFSRSVNTGSRYRAWRWKDLMELAKARKRHAWGRDIAQHVHDYDDEPWWWDVNGIYAQEEADDDWEWAPVDSCLVIESCEQPAQRPQVGLKMTSFDSLRRMLKAAGAIMEENNFGKTRFGELQEEFLWLHGTTFCKQLALSQNKVIQMAPAPVSSDVQEKFLNARSSLKGVLRPAYHGTNVTNLPSIYEKGLLVPSSDNGIHVANGSAHGVGVYTAKVVNPSLSWGFCRAPTEASKTMMVCGILDDAPTFSGQAYTMGVHLVTCESTNVRHVGDAMVIFDDRRVVPLFEFSLSEESYLITQDAVRSSYNWEQWQIKLQQVMQAFPTKLEKRRIRLLRFQPKQNTVASYLGRRGASKHR